MSATRTPSANLETGKSVSGYPHLAYLLFRLAIGMSMAIHGLIRIAHGPGQFAAELTKRSAAGPLPAGLVHAFGLCLVWFEALVGILLLLGLFTAIAAAASAIEMIALIFGSALMQDWTLVMLQLFYALLFYILLLKIEDNTCSLDWLRGAKKAG